MISESIIRPEMPSDYAAITHVNDLAFGRPNEGVLIEKLRELPEFLPNLSLVAEIDGEIVGHIVLLPVIVRVDHSTAEAEIQNAFAHKILSLGPIAVRPDFQNQGIGGQLIGTSHKIAKELGFRAVVLLGHPSYYPRFGYKMAQFYGLTNPWGIHEEPWMAVELSDGALSNSEGCVLYPEPFNDAA